MSDHQLTDEQIKNWRIALSAIVGPWAMLMSVEDIEKFRDKFQEKFRDKFQAAVDKLPQTETEPMYCTCDPSYIGATTKRDGTVVCHKCKKERKANE